MPREAKVVPPCNSPIVNIENKVLHAGGHNWKTAAGVALRDSDQYKGMENNRQLLTPTIF
jgi:hypothetical protein